MTDLDVAERSLRAWQRELILNRPCALLAPAHIRELEARIAKLRAAQRPRPGNADWVKAHAD